MTMTKRARWSLLALTLFPGIACDAPREAPTGKPTTPPVVDTVSAPLPRIERASSSTLDVGALAPKVCALSMEESEAALVPLFGAPLSVHTPGADTRELVFHDSDEGSLRAVFVKGALIDVTAVRTSDARLVGQTEQPARVVLETHAWTSGKTPRATVEGVLGGGETVLARRTSLRPSTEKLDAAHAARPDLSREQLAALFSACLEKRLFKLGPNAFVVLTFSGDTLFM